MIHKRIITALILALASCSAPSPPPPQPVIETPEPAAAVAVPRFVQVGRASWYGRGFAGKKTADGNRFDPEAMVAAHRTLPMGTVVRVTNQENGKMVKVTIKDRGPHIRGRIIDLSAKAARDLDMHEDGIARVKIEVYSDDQPPTPPASTT